MMQINARTRRPLGLTLLELVMTVAVLAVLGVLALPSLGGQLAHQRLRHAAQTFAGDVAEARFLAAQKGRSVHLLGREGTQWCWAVALEPGCDCGSSSASCAVHTVGLADHPGVRLVSPMTMRLDAGGMPDSSSSAIFESANGERLRVDVTAQGRARICAAAGDWPRLPAC